MEKILYAGRGMTDSLKKLWHESFGDDYGYINLFFENRFSPDRCVIMAVDGIPISAVHLMDADAGGCPVLYAYAVATLPEYRGRKITARLFDRVLADFRRPLILRPAEDGLRAYYRKCGFTDAFVSQSEIITRGEFDRLYSGLSTTDAQKYKKLRDAFFTEREIPYIRWDFKGIEYALAENAFCGGGALSDGYGVLLYRPENESIRIIENTVHYNPSLSGFGMARNPDSGYRLTDDKAYLNLVLE